MVEKKKKATEAAPETGNKDSAKKTNSHYS